jgi:hypothetical protein
MQTTIKKSSKFTKKITYVDDMMIHNLVKYLIQTRLRLWDIKITNFKPESCLNNLLEICYFYILQMKSSLDKIFYKVVYHHIIYICDFLVNLDNFFAMVYMAFHERCGFHLICCLTRLLEENPACYSIVKLLLAILLMCSMKSFPTMGG